MMLSTHAETGGTEAEEYIREINTANRILLPVSIGPYGDYGPIFRNFLFGQGPLRDMTPFRDRPQANLALKRATTHPAPIGVVITTSVAWKKNKSRTFFGHSYTAPTPRESSSSSLASTPRKHSQSCFKIHSATLSASREDQADRRTADPPPPQADPRPTQFTFSDAPMMG